MSLIQVLFLIAIWVVPITLLIRIYLKITKEEKGKFREEFRRSSVLLGLGIPVFGLLLQHTGVILLFISWIATSALSWKRNQTGTMQVSHL